MFHKDLITKNGDFYDFRLIEYDFFKKILPKLGIEHHQERIGVLITEAGDFSKEIRCISQPKMSCDDLRKWGPRQQ